MAAHCFKKPDVLAVLLLLFEGPKKHHPAQGTSRLQELCAGIDAPLLCVSELTCPPLLPPPISVLLLQGKDSHVFSSNLGLKQPWILAFSPALYGVPFVSRGGGDDLTWGVVTHKWVWSCKTCRGCTPPPSAKAH